MTDNKLTHFDASGNAVMVDVSEKTVTFREATAHGIITMNACLLYTSRRAALQRHQQGGPALL